MKSTEEHCGIGFELVLDTAVPQLARELELLVDIPVPCRGGGSVEVGQGSTLHASAPVAEYFSPAPAVSQSPAPVMEFLSSTPAVSLLPDPVVEHFAPAPAVFLSHVPVVDCTSRGEQLSRAGSVPNPSASD